MSPPNLEVADVFRRHGAGWRAANEGHLNLAQRRVNDGDRDLSHRSARRPCRAMRGLRPYARRLQLVPQPPLPEMPMVGGETMDGGAQSRTVACSLFPRRVYAAREDRRHRIPEQGQGLWALVPDDCRDPDDDCRRPETSWR